MSSGSKHPRSPCATTGDADEVVHEQSLKRVCLSDGVAAPAAAVTEDSILPLLLQEVSLPPSDGDLPPVEYEETTFVLPPIEYSPLPTLPLPVPPPPPPPPAPPAAAADDTKTSDVTIGDEIESFALPPGPGESLTDSQMQLLLLCNILLPKQRQQQRAASTAWQDTRLFVSYPIVWSLLVECLEDPNHSICAHATQRRGIVMVAVNTDTKATSSSTSSSLQGNHWVTLIVDGQRRHVLYIDSLGHPIEHRNLRAALRRAFPMPEWTHFTLGEPVQDDGWSCGWWVFITMSRYFMYARDHPIVGSPMFSTISPIDGREYARRICAEDPTAGENNRILLREMIAHARHQIGDYVRLRLVHSNNYLLSSA